MSKSSETSPQPGKLKYHINRYLNNVHRGVDLKTVTSWVYEQCGIPAGTFHRHRSIPAGRATTIPETSLELYAKFFGCTATELRNYKLPEVKPLAELNAKAAQKIEKGQLA